MGITVSNSETKPAIAYNKVHMTSLNITHPIFNDDLQTPIYNVSISYKLFGVVDGVRHYKDEIEKVGIEDYTALAIQKASEGDTTLLDALDSIERAVSAILGEQTNLITSVD